MGASYPAIFALYVLETCIKILFRKFGMENVIKNFVPRPVGSADWLRSTAHAAATGVVM